MTFKYILMICCLSLFTSSNSQAADKTAPLKIGGFTLGSQVEDYDFISYRNFLKQVVVQDIDGFRKGIIYYGICNNPGEIVKIKLKYLDSSESFYKKLLKRYIKNFGKPDAYIGDTFGIVKTWKWIFIDKKSNKVLLRLQHNLKNPDESLGNTVKLEYPDRIEAERVCFNKQCASRRGGEKKRLPPNWSKESWQHMIPK